MSLAPSREFSCSSRPRLKKLCFSMLALRIGFEDIVGLLEVRWTGGSVNMHTADKVAEIAFPAATTDVTPFEVHVPQAALDDLKKRLANARWPDKEPSP